MRRVDHLRDQDVPPAGTGNNSAGADRQTAQPVSNEVMDSVMGFFYLYIICFVLLAIMLGALGLDFITALSGAATSISNVGPGLGNLIGAEGNFASLPDAAKWIMSFGMLLGRLELFTVLVMLNPGFWRR
jgi:trk system potassium uptake protein TrkH